MMFYINHHPYPFPLPNSYATSEILSIRKTICPRSELGKDDGWGQMNGLTCASRSIINWQNYLYSWFALWSKLLALGANIDHRQQRLYSMIWIFHVELLTETGYAWSVDAHNNDQILILTLVITKSERAHLLNVYEVQEVGKGIRMMNPQPKSGRPKAP